MIAITISPYVYSLHRAPQMDHSVVSNQTIPAHSSPLRSIAIRHFAPFPPFGATLRQSSREEARYEHLHDQAFHEHSPSLQMGGVGTKADHG